MRVRKFSRRSSDRAGTGRAAHVGPCGAEAPGAESNRAPSSTSAARPSARTWWKRMSIETCPSSPSVRNQISHGGCAWSNGRSFNSTQVANSFSSPPGAGSVRVRMCRPISKLASSTQTGAPKPNPGQWSLCRSRGARCRRCSILALTAPRASSPDALSRASGSRMARAATFTGRPLCRLVPRGSCHPRRAVETRGGCESHSGDRESQRVGQASRSYTTRHAGSRSAPTMANVLWRRIHGNRLHRHLGRIGDQCIAGHRARKLFRCRLPPAEPTPDRKPVDRPECEDADDFGKPPVLPPTR